MRTNKLGIDIVELEGKPAIKIFNTHLTEYQTFHTAKDLLKKAGVYTEAMKDIQGNVDALAEEAKKAANWKSHARDRLEDLLDSVEPPKGLQKKVAFEYSARLNKAIYNITGRNQKHLLKQINAMMYKVFVAPLPRQIVGDHCFGNKGKLNARRLKVVNNNLKFLVQAYEDSCRHVSPLILVTGKTPEQLKDTLGKGLWKQLCRNTLHRNKLIATAFPSTSRAMELKEALQALNSLPSALIRPYNLGLSEFSGLTWVKDNLKGKWSKRKEVQDSLNLFHDTVRMLKQLERDPATALKWSARRLKEEHDNISRELLMKSHSDKRFSWLDTLPIGNFCYGEFEVQILDNALAMKMEGQAMSHCVGSYADEVKRGTYLTFSVLKKGERSSTIGLSRRITTMIVDELNGKGETSETITYSFSQQYGRFNKSVTDLAEQEIPGFILETLGKDSVKH